MNRDINAYFDEHSENWAFQFRNDPSFTESDIIELKAHLQQVFEDLVESGLNNEEAFFVASSRVGSSTQLHEIYEDANQWFMQARKFLLMVSGGLSFFLLFYFLVFLIRFSFYFFSFLKFDFHQITFGIIGMVAVYHVLIFSFSLIGYLKKKSLVHKIAGLKIKPLALIYIFCALTIFVLADLVLQTKIKGIFGVGSYKLNVVREIVTYTGFTLPFLVLLSIFINIKQYARVFSLNPNDQDKNYSESETCDVSSTPFENFVFSNQIGQHCHDEVKALCETGLDIHEAQWVVLSRNGVKLSLKSGDAIKASQSEARFFPIFLSGILFFLFTNFAFLLITKVLFKIMQIVENIPNLNIARTWTFVGLSQLAIIFFSVSLYLKDKNAYSLLKRISINSKNLIWLFILTVIFAIADRCFYPISISNIPNQSESIASFFQIFFITSYTFPLIFVGCFLLLFKKYFKENYRYLYD